MEKLSINFTRISVGLKKWALFAILLSYGLAAYAQPDYHNGTSGTSNNSFPLNSTTNKVQWIYDPGMFTSTGTGAGQPAFAGLITHVYFRIGSTLNTNSTYSNFTIKLGQNVGTQTTWSSSTWNTGLTTCFQATSHQLTGATTNSWYMVQLQTPFVYDPTQSLVFEISTSGGTGATVLQYTANGNRRIWGASSSTPNGSSYGSGLVDFGFDIVPLNVEVTGLTYPSSMCEKEQVQVQVEIENTDVVARSGFLVQYKINGTVYATESYTNSIPAGQKANYTFNMPVDNDMPGNYTISANILGKNTFVDQAYTVLPAPTGSFVSKGAIFNGTFSSGASNDPDIVAYGDQIGYEIEPPTGFTNSGYGSTWAFDFYEFLTPGGSSAGSAHVRTDASGSANTMVDFTPVIGLSDSTFILRYAMKDLGNGCFAPTIERQVFVAPRPVAGFNATSACEGAQLSFTNTSTISSGFTSHKWYFGDGDSSVIINPNHVYTTAGTYTVNLVVESNYGYTDTYTSQVTVFQNPVAAFTAVNVCEGAANTFADNSFIPAGTPVYEWTWGDGSAMGAGANPSHQYATPGTYTVKMKVTANSCSGTATKEVTYAPRAVPDFNFVQVDCNNDEVSFTNASTVAFGQVGYSWNYGDNITGTGVNPKHTYATGGTFNVTMTATTDMGCVNQTSKTVTLKEAPAADFSIQNLCDKDDVEFTNTSTEPSGPVTTYDWKFSDGTVISTKDAGRSFPSVGAYSVTLIAYSDNGCTDEKKMTFSVDEEPSAQFFANPVCEGNATQFQNSSNGNQGNFTNAWDFGGGLTSTDKNPSQTLAVGTHNVSLTVSTPSGCTASITKTVTVTENPKSSSYVVETATKGDGSMQVIATVTPANAAYTILWGDGGKSTGAASNGNIAETYRYISDGLYNVQLRLTNSGCQTTEIEQASVKRTGLVDMVAGELKVYPNPSNGIFQIDLAEITLVNSIHIYAANGQEILVNPEMMTNGARIDMSGVAGGVYLIRVNTDNGVYTARVTISK